MAGPQLAVPRRFMDVLWFLPTHGDGRHLGTSERARAVDLPYLRQIAQAADALGFHGVLLPTGRSCEDAWVVAATMVPLTQRLRVLVALRPGVMSPTVAARMTATLDRLSSGRVFLNVVTGGDPAESEGDGVFLGHDERYAVAGEFLSIYKRILTGETVDFEGKHLSVKGARVHFPPVQRPHPPIYMGGSSEAAHELAAHHVDVYLTWGEPPAAVAEKIADVRRRAAALGREVRFGLRVHVIVRETSAEAWAAADDLIKHLDERSIAMAQKAFAHFESEGQRRMAALHGGRRDRLEVSPNLWGGGGPRAGRRGDGARRRRRDSRRAHARIPGARRRYVRSLGVSAPRGGLPRRRVALSVASPVASRHGHGAQHDRAVRGDARPAVRAPGRLHANSPRLAAADAASTLRLYAKGRA